jgi:hypothetical protein
MRWHKGILETGKVQSENVKEKEALAGIGVYGRITLQQIVKTQTYLDVD